MSEEAKCWVSRCHLLVHASSISQISPPSSWRNSLSGIIKVRGSTRCLMSCHMEVFLSLTSETGGEEIKLLGRSMARDQERETLSVTEIINWELQEMVGRRETERFFTLVICIFSCNRVSCVLCSQHTLGSPLQFHNCFYLRSSGQWMAHNG